MLPQVARIDLRYASLRGGGAAGGGRYHEPQNADTLAPFAAVTAAGVGADETATAASTASPVAGAAASPQAAAVEPVASWLDPRNLARQQQFRHSQAALMRSAGGVAVADDTTTTATATPTSWHPITEFFWLAGRAAAISQGAAIARR